MTLVKQIALTALVASLVGCGDSPTAPSTAAPFSQTDLQVGSGATAASGNRLTVHYTLWLYDATSADQKGIQLESTTPESPFIFTLTGGQVIDGWIQGVSGMREGGRRRLVVPPSLGYGQSRNGIIPPNATLLFEIQLVTVEVL